MNKFLFGNASSKAMVLARIGIMMALTVLVQYLTGLAGIQLLTGSFVNLFLLLSTILTGVVGGITIGIVTPFIALLLGLNPNVTLVPFIAIGNAVYCVLFAVFAKFFNAYSKEGVLLPTLLAVAVVIAATSKFLFMYIVCVKLLFPLFLAQAMVAKLSVAWGVMQLFTALIGGVVTITLTYPLKKLKMLPTN